MSVKAVGDGEDALAGGAELAGDHDRGRKPEQERRSLAGERQEDIGAKPGLLRLRRARGRVVHSLRCSQTV